LIEFASLGSARASVVNHALSALVFAAGLAGLTVLQLFGFGPMWGRWYGHGWDRSSIDLATRWFAGPTRCGPPYNLVTDPNTPNYKLTDLVEPALYEGPAVSIGCPYDWWSSPLDLNLIGELQVRSRSGTGNWISTKLLPEIGGAGY